MRLAVTVARGFASARCGGVSSRFTATRFLLNALCCTLPLTEADGLLPASVGSFPSPSAFARAFFEGLLAADGEERLQTGG